MGKAIAEKFLAEGFSVAVCARGREALYKLQAEWATAYPAATIFTYAADLSNGSEADAFADAVLATFPSVDVLVNNAGMFIPGTLTGSPSGNLELMMGLNLYAAYHLARKIAPVMISAGKGHIFNICSVAGIEAHPHAGSYSVSKYALAGLTENLRAELRPHNVKVTAFYPGSTNTSSWDNEDADTSGHMLPSDIATMLWAAYALSPQAIVDHIVMRPVKD